MPSVSLTLEIKGKEEKIMINYGTYDEFSKLKSVLMCPPANFEIRKPINIIQEKWHKIGRGPDPTKRVQQYEALKNVLIREGVVVWEIPPSKKYTYQVFTRDTGIVTKQRAIIAIFKFDPRKGEEKEVAQELEVRKIDISYLFEEKAVFEGGDFVFLDHENVLLGIGDRTNTQALTELMARLPSFNFHPVYLPKDYLHLDVVLNIISQNAALAFTHALPDDTLSFLEKRRFRIIDVSTKEQETMATNVLALGHKKIISATCNKQTNMKLKKEGFEVIEIEMSEILKGGGGPRCMTLPILRE